MPLTKTNIRRANQLVKDTMQAIRGLPPRIRRLEKPAIQAIPPEAVRRLIRAALNGARGFQ